MAEEDFQFSLYRNDLIFIQCGKDSLKLHRKAKESNHPKVKEESSGLYYFNAFDISMCNLKIETDDDCYSARTAGKNLALIQKYNIDPIGNYTPVKCPEKRKGFR